MSSKVSSFATMPWPIAKVCTAGGGTAVEVIEPDANSPPLIAAHGSNELAPISSPNVR